MRPGHDTLGYLGGFTTKGLKPAKTGIGLEKDISGGKFKKSKARQG